MGVMFKVYFIFKTGNKEDREYFCHVDGIDCDGQTMHEEET
jgi:hypothetical protein